MFMMLVQLPECGGFDLNFADRLRKSIAKKNPAEYDQLTKEYFETIKAKNLDYNLCNYVWNVLVATSKGYGFNASHTLAYSLVGLQEMNLAYRFPVIIWNCACLIADSGGAEVEEESSYEEIIVEDEVEEEEDKKKRARSVDYKKIATAIGKMQQAGISIKPPDINNSSYTFTPDVQANEIIFGLSGILNVGEDVIAATIKHRPYTSPRDYCDKVKPTKTAMVSLIKAGAFDTMMDRKVCLGWYLWENCDKKQKLTLQNMPTLIKYDMIPHTDDFGLPMRVYEFNRYLKFLTKQDSAAYNDYYTLDARAMEFLTEIGMEELISSDNLAWFVSKKKWDKLYDKYVDVFRVWMSNNKEEILVNLNQTIFKEAWNKYAKGTISAWEMEVICYYYHEHELINLDKERYGIVEYSSLPEEPVVDKVIVEGGKTINLFKLDKIAGTCIAKDKAKATVTLLTTSGVVNVKFRKEYYSIFDKQISEVGSDGKKSVKEKSWFNRGNMIIVHGMRSGDEFMAKKYASSASHQLYRILQINEDGTIEITNERYQGGNNE